MKAVLFDFDGVVVDSMHEHARAWGEAFEKQGVTINPNWILENEGRSAQSCATLLAGEMNTGWPQETIQDVIRAKEELFGRVTELRPYDGIAGILAELKKSRKAKALVTGSPMKTVLHVLKEECHDWFDVLVTSSDGIPGKPDPAPYLRAAEKLRVSIQDCVVVENAHLGVSAAKKAGAYCIGLLTTSSREALSEADEWCVDHSELAQRLHALC